MLPNTCRFSFSKEYRYISDITNPMWPTLDLKMSDSYATWIRKGVSIFFEYDTPRIVHIRSKKVGVISR